MKRSLTVFILTLVLIIGTLASPALAYSGNYRSHSYHNIINPINTYGRYTIITIHGQDRAGMLLKLNNWYINMRSGNPGENLLEPESGNVKQDIPTPEENSAPKEQPKKEQPPVSDNQPAPKPVPQPEEKPVPTPEPKPVPEPEEEPTSAPQPKPVEKPKEEKPQVPAPPQGIGGQQAQMLEKVNEERVNAGLSPLKWDGNLASVAQAKAKDMADNNYFDHNSPTYGSPFEMMKKFGISYRAAGENLAGSSSVERAHMGLMNSDGHRKNILNPNFTHMGIGVEKSSRYGYVYVQMFIGK